MKALIFATNLILLIAFQLAGEACKYWLNSPLPAPLFGIGLFFLFLCLSPVKPPSLLDTGNTMLRYLPLFFIPPGVALLAYGSLIKLHGFAILSVLCISTIITMIFTVYLLKKIKPASPLQEDSRVD